jgi:universal stress protein E
LRRIATGARLPTTTQCVVRWDYPIYEAIVRQVLLSKPDLLVTESHREGRLARLLLANTDWQLMRECPCPLWFVRSAELPRRPRVLVAVDPRHTHAKPAKLDDRLLQAARALTRQLGGRVALVHAYETPASAVPGMMMEPMRLPLSPQLTRNFVAATQRAVDKLGTRHRIAAADRAVRAGAPSLVIPAEANAQHADVLFMGAVSRSLLARPIIGSTAERVIDHVDCDVFVVKPRGFKSRVRRAAVRA